MTLMVSTESSVLICFVSSKQSEVLSCHDIVKDLLYIVGSASPFSYPSQHDLTSSLLSWRIEMGWSFFIQLFISQIEKCTWVFFCCMVSIYKLGPRLISVAAKRPPLLSATFAGLPPDKQPVLSSATASISGQNMNATNITIKLADLDD